MTTSRAAQGNACEGDDTEKDRDTVELSSEDLSRLRSLDDQSDPESADPENADPDSADRDTVEITNAEAVRLAQGQSDERAEETTKQTEDTDSDTYGGEVVVAARMSLNDIDKEALDRAAVTIPAPPSFDEEE